MIISYLILRYTRAFIISSSIVRTFPFRVQWYPCASCIEGRKVLGYLQVCPLSASLLWNRIGLNYLYPWKFFTSYGSIVLIHRAE